MSELDIRPLQSGETQLFLSYPFARTAGLWETARDYEALLASNEYRPEHTWIALRDGIVVARACFWAGRDDRHPMSLDWLEASPGPQQVEWSAALLRTAHQTMRNADGKRPEYHLFMPPGSGAWFAGIGWRVAVELARRTSGRRPGAMATE